MGRQVKQQQRLVQHARARVRHPAFPARQRIGQIELGHGSGRTDPDVQGAVQVDRPGIAGVDIGQGPRLARPRHLRPAAFPPAPALEDQTRAPQQRLGRGHIGCP